MSDEVMVMNQGRAVEMADGESIYRDPQNPYTRKLLDSIPRGVAGRLLV
jgi:peptide/nickel transport system ATP-binding protein